MVASPAGHINYKCITSKH